MASRVPVIHRFLASTTPRRGRNRRATACSRRALAARARVDVAAAVDPSVLIEGDNDRHRLGRTPGQHKRIQVGSKPFCCRGLVTELHAKHGRTARAGTSHSTGTSATRIPLMAMVTLSPDLSSRSGFANSVKYTRPGVSVAAILRNAPIFGGAGAVSRRLLA